jgi:hypothetical protein
MGARGIEVCGLVLALSLLGCGGKSIATGAAEAGSGSVGSSGSGAGSGSESSGGSGSGSGGSASGSGSGGSGSGSSSGGDSATEACARLTTCCGALPSSTIEQSGCFSVAASNSTDCQAYLSEYIDGGKCDGASGGTGSSSGSATGACAKLTTCCGTLPSMSVEQAGCFGEAASNNPTVCQLNLAGFMEAGHCQ